MHLNSHLGMPKLKQIALIKTNQMKYGQKGSFDFFTIPINCLFTAEFSSSEPMTPSSCFVT